MNTISVSLRLALLLCSLPALACGQQPSDNYVRTIDMLDSTGVDRHVMVAYADGLGRTVHTVEDAPVDGTTVSVGKTYDTRGRLLVCTIPCESDGYGKLSATDIINELAQHNPGENTPFTLYGYDALDREVTVRGPGDGWLTHPVARSYGGNAAQTVIRFKVSDGRLTRDGWYAQGELTKESVTDEDGNVTVVYKDFTGNTISEQHTSSGNNSTYYVYDDIGRLSYVLPPGAFNGLNTLGGTGPWDEGTAPVAGYAYIYKYDAYGRLAEKKLPGCEPQHFWYDHGGRLAFSDDGNLRRSDRRVFYLYDSYGRQVVKGICKGTTAPDVRFKDMKVSYFSGGPYGGYGSGISLDSVVMLTADYYDFYTFTNGTPSLQFSADTVATHYIVARSLHTGHRSYILGSQDAIETTAIYYDERARPVQSRRLSSVTGLNCVSRRYSFSGKTLLRLHTQSGLYNTELTESYSYTYHPKTDALLTVTHSINGSTPVTLASYTYDALGRTATKTVGGIETISYGYNIRSWPTRIESAKFTELMGYNTMLDGRRSMNPQFGGNISALSWKQGNSSYRGYELYYDDYGRLTDASYGEGLAFSSNGNRYDELFGYDRMGNITTLARNGKLDGSLLYGCIDDLEMEYDGNQLTRVYDNESDNDPTYEGAMQFTDNSDEDVEYEYDQNGNMTKDLNSNITSIQYNCLNLPSRIYFTNRHVMDYVYNADGELLQMSARALHQLPRPQLDTKYYAGNVIFTGRFLSMLLTDEGYVTFASNGTPTYHYYLKDHLGNVRVVFNQTGTVEQRNDYYPSGALMATSTGGSVQPYKYNGKELERIAGLDLYDYGARWMDSKIGARFTTIDPMCEKYYGISPYAYCKDNPVNLLDPDGRVVIIHYLNQDGKYVYQKYFGKMTSHNNQFFQDVIDTYHYFKETGGGENFIEAVESKDIEVHIYDANLFGTSTKSSPYDGDACVFWQSRKGLLLTNGGKQSPATRLEHEFDHVMDQEKNPNEHAERQKGKDKDYDNKEERRVILGSERDTAKKHGEGIRYDHRGKPYETKGPTTTEEER